MLKKIIYMFIISSCTISCGVSEQLEELSQEADDASVEDEEFSKILTEFGLTEEGVDSEEAEESLLSEDAQAVMTEVKEIGSEVRTQLDAICSRDDELRDTIRAEIKEILENEELSDEEKRAAVKEVKDFYREDMEASKDEFETCVADNQEDWDNTKAIFDPIKEACLIEKEEGHRGPRHLRRPAPKLLDEETIAAFEEKLLSDECATAIDDYNDTYAE